MAYDSDQGNKITHKQTTAIAALLTEKDVQSAATLAGVSRRTLTTWLTQPAFKTALEKAESTQIDAVVSRLAGVAGEAVEVLTTIMKDEKRPAGVRVRAAHVVLDQLMKLRELHQLEQRIATLEALANNER